MLPVTQAEAAEILRSLIDAIVLTPAEDELHIEVQGDLAGILTIAVNAKGRPERASRFT